MAVIHAALILRCYPFDMKFIGAVATRIVNEVKGVNRVVCDERTARHDRVGVAAHIIRSQMAAAIACFRRGGTS